MDTTVVLLAHAAWIRGDGPLPDLSGADLIEANLSGADLSGANLRRADLSGANLFWANLSGANLRRANLSGADLSGANLSGANLSGADLSGADLSGADLRRADLSGANLIWAKLSGADLSGAKGCVRLPVGDPRGYDAVVVEREGALVVCAGCRTFILDEALAHWGTAYKGDPNIGRRYIRAIEQYVAGDLT